MKIGEVAAAAGVTVDTVRYYERRGLLPAPERRPSGYRIYGPATVERITLARRLQQLGLTLDEIADTLRAHDAGGATCDNQRWRFDVVRERIDGQIAELTALRQAIDDVRGRCDDGTCAELAWLRTTPGASGGQGC